MSTSLPLGGTLTLPGVGAHSPAADEAAASVVRYPAVLWTRRDVVQLVVLSVVGVGLMAVSWYLSGDGQPLDRQMHRINLAVAGLLIGMVGGGLFLLRGLGAVAARKAAVKALTHRRLGARVATTPTSATTGGGLVAGPGMTRYHDAGCSLVAGKTVAAASRADHEHAGRRPCGVCLRRAAANAEDGR
jgi:hypothetical protein